MQAEPKSAPADQPSDLSSLVSLQSVLCTEELTRRPPRSPDYERENRALASLTQALAHSPHSILQTLADTILEVFRADSAGISVLAEDGEKFCWPAIAGAWKSHVGADTPRDFGPCGDVLDRNCPLLFRHFERRYTYFLAMTPAIEECLMVPFYVAGDAVGTIWAIAHDDRRKFDNEDLRMLVSMATFAAAAYQMAEQLRALSKQAYDRQEVQKSLREMNEALLLGSVRQHELTQTAEKLNDQLREAIAVANQANIAKSDFLSSVSHELRTPLSAILGFAQLMESDLPPPTPPQKRSIEQILKAGWYLLDLINEILDLALIESGKLSLSREPVSLGEILFECRSMVDAQAQQRGISVVFPPVESLFVNADPTRLKQILVNLLSNAIKYNRVGGTVVVDLVTNIPGRVRICVKDTGEGITPERLAQLFQPFNRLGKEAGIEQGTGIGLIVSKRLVELMGGVIAVESTVGVGSTFCIELSWADAPQLAAGTANCTPAARGQAQAATELRSLLYVEDNTANLMLVEDLIERRSDIRLLSARDGNRGVDMARAARPDVILMDINLPGISGIDALKILAQDPATAHIPVIAISANAMPRDIETGLAAGFFRYLTKPIRIDELMDTLDAALKVAKTRSGGPTKEERA